MPYSVMRLKPLLLGIVLSLFLYAVIAMITIAILVAVRGL